MIEPRVKDIIANYQKGNIKQVYEYLTQPDMCVDENSWANQIKKMIENKQFENAKEAIEIVAYKFIKLK